MNSDEEYTAIQRAEVLNELRAYLDKSHAPGAYKMMVDALEADANRLAALTRPPSDEEVGRHLLFLDEIIRLRSDLLNRKIDVHTYLNRLQDAAALFEGSALLIRRLSHQLSEAREKLRRFAIVARHVPCAAPGPTTVRVGLFCKLCEAESDDPAPLVHADDCTLKSSDETKK